MRVMVTGGSGFIGAWIVKGFLEAGIGVTVLDLKDDRRIGRLLIGDRIDEAEWITGDISSIGAVLAASRNCDQIVHLAALLTPDCAADPIRGVNVNVSGTLNIFEAARRHGMKQVLYMSSASVFGPDNGVDPNPITLYGVWKLAMEGGARCYFEDHAIASAGFRPLVVYGPGREVGISAGPSIAIASALNGDAYTIPFSGRTDMIYVEDVVAAFVQAATRGVTGAKTYSIVGEAVSMDDWIAAIKTHVPEASLAASGPVLPVTDDIHPGTLREDYAEVARTSVADGVARTIAWYRENDVT